MYFYDLPNNIEIPPYNNPTMQTLSESLTFTFPQCISTTDTTNKTKKTPFPSLEFNCPFIRKSQQATDAIAALLTVSMFYIRYMYFAPHDLLLSPLQASLIHVFRSLWSVHSCIFLIFLFKPPTHKSVSRSVTHRNLGWGGIF